MREEKMPGRPREFDEDVALGQIMELFWANGYEGTALSDIMSATGLNKGSLYSAFGNKHEMYMKALANYEALIVDGGCHALRSEGDPADKLEAFLSAPIEAAFKNGDRRGCFLCNASADRAAIDSETQAMVQRGYDKIERALETVVRELKPGLPKAEMKGRARLALTIYSGLRVMARSADSRAQLESVKSAAMQTLLA